FRSVPTSSWRCTSVTCAHAIPAAAWTPTARPSSTSSSPAAGTPDASSSCARTGGCWRWPSPTWSTPRCRPSTPSTIPTRHTVDWARWRSCTSWNGPASRATATSTWATGSPGTRKWSTSGASARSRSMTAAAGETWNPETPHDPAATPAPPHPQLLPDPLRLPVPPPLATAGRRRPGRTGGGLRPHDHPWRPGCLGRGDALARGGAGRDLQHLAVRRRRRWPGCAPALRGRGGAQRRRGPATRTPGRGVAQRVRLRRRGHGGNAVPAALPGAAAARRRRGAPLPLPLPGPGQHRRTQRPRPGPRRRGGWRRPRARQRCVGLWPAPGAVRHAGALAAPDPGLAGAHVPPAAVERDAGGTPAHGSGDRAAVVPGRYLAPTAPVVQITLGRPGRDADRDRAPARGTPDAAGVRRAGGPQRQAQRRRDPALVRVHRGRRTALAVR